MRPSGGSAPSRRHAWTVFEILFALMVVDYVDRQIVVSMFPHLKAQWALSDASLAAWCPLLRQSSRSAPVPISLLADRWSRVKSIFLMALVCVDASERSTGNRLEAIAAS